MECQRSDTERQNIYKNVIVLFEVQKKNTECNIQKNIKASISRAMFSIKCAMRNSKKSKFIRQ